MNGERVSCLLEIILFSPNTVPISRTVKISQKELATLVTDFRAGLLNHNIIHLATHAETELQKGNVTVTEALRRAQISLIDIPDTHFFCKQKIE